METTSGFYLPHSPFHLDPLVLHATQESPLWQRHITWMDLETYECTADNWMDVKWTNKLTYDETWPPREAVCSCVSLFTLNDPKQPTVGSHIIIKWGAHKAWCLYPTYPTFGPRSPRIPLTPAFPRFPWQWVCSVCQWGNNMKQVQNESMTLFTPSDFCVAKSNFWFMIHQKCGFDIRALLPSFPHSLSSLVIHSHHHLPVRVKHKLISEKDDQYLYAIHTVYVLKDPTFSPLMPCFPSGPGLPCTPCTAATDFC